MQSGFIASSASLPCLQAAIHALRFIHDEDRTGCLDQVNGFFAAGLFAVLIEVVHVLFIDCADRHHHDLNMRAGGEIAHLAELR